MLASRARNGNSGGVAVAERPVREPSLLSGRPVGWLDAVNSQVGLKPVTMINARAILQKQREEDDDGGPSQYQIHIPSAPIGKRVKESAPVVLAKKAMQQSRWSYQKLFIRLGGLLRWIDDTAYGFSILSLILAIVGVIMNHHSYTIMGLSGIVLLSALRVWMGVSNLVVKIFKKDPISGLIFLIPPVAAYKIINNWPKWEKSIKRVINPALIICAVAVAYIYVPWINGKRKFTGNFKSQFEQSLEAVKRDSKATLSEVSKQVSAETEKLKHDIPKKLEGLKLDEMSKQAGKTLENVSDKVSKSVESTVSDVNKSLKKATADGKNDDTKPPVKTNE